MNLSTFDIYHTELIKVAIEKGINRIEARKLQKTILGADYLLSPSGAGRCNKIHLFQALEYSPELSIDKNSIFLLNLGNIMHKDKQRKLRKWFDNLENKEGKELLIERNLTNKQNTISGSADIIYKDGDNIEIHDDKNIGSYSWKMKVSAQRYKNRGDKGEPTYELQAWTYALIVAELFNVSEDKIKVYLDFHNKDNSDTRTLQVSPKYKDKTKKYWDGVYEFIEKYKGDINNTDIEGGNHFSVPVAGWDCNYCSFAMQCNSPLRTKPLMNIIIKEENNV